MAITLPTVTGGGVGIRRPRQTGQPTAADVPRTPLARDPGVQVPDLGAGGRALEGVGESVSSVGQDLGEVALRQQTRRDAIEFSRDVNLFTRTGTDELERVNSEDDLSLDKVQNAFGGFLSAKRQEAVGNYKGSQAGRAALEARLIGIEETFIGTASGIATTISRGMIDQAVEESLGPLMAQVRQDPSKGNIDRLFGELDVALGDLSAGFDDPTQEKARRLEGRERLALSALETQLNRGNVEEALELLDDQGLAKEISDTAAATIRQRAADIARARDGALRQIEQAEAIAGRPLTASERLSIIGVGTSGEELVEIGDSTSPTGSRFVPRSQAAGQPGRPRVQPPPNIGSIPPGFQVVRDPGDPNILRMEPIPGGPEDVDAADRVKKEVLQKELTIRKSKVVVRDIDRVIALLDDSFLPAAGPIAGTFDFPGTPSFDLNIQLNSIKSAVGFGALQDMRNASPTGGALGQVSENENTLLQSTLGSLDNRQKPEVLKVNLLNIRELYLDAWFGTPAELEAAVERGPANGGLTEEAAASLQKQRETVGFDAIGRALGSETKKSATSDKAGKQEKPQTGDDKTDKQVATPGSPEPDDILVMGADEIKLLDFPNLTPEQAVAADQRLGELGF